MGSVYNRRNKLWCAFKDLNGKRCLEATPFAVGEENLAKRYLAAIERRVAKGESPHTAR